MGDEIDIAEPRDLLGEGLAYQTRDPIHRLNVPSGRMSAIEDLPDDFAKWSDVEPYTFMQRQSYSSYLRERLGSAVNHIQENIVDLVPTKVGAVATFSSGESKRYDSVILAMGHGEARQSSIS